MRRYGHVAEAWGQRLREKIRLALPLILVVATLPVLQSPALAADDYPSEWGDPPQDSVVDDWGYYNRECTSFVAWRLHSRNGYEMPYAIGNADNWDDWFEDAGVTVNSTPAVGAIAQSDADGHVAWVLAVNSDGTVTVEEYNYGTPGAYSKRTVAQSSFVYIHVKDLRTKAKLSVKKTGSGTVTSSPSGINCGSDCAHEYSTSTTVTLTATPASSYTFGGWGGDCSGTSTCKLTMSKTRAVTASFVLDPLMHGGFRGDFNGDGLDDVGAFYNYGGSQTKLRIFYATGSDSFAIPTVAWDSGDGNWNWSKTKQVVGDFNGDGKDDVGAFYGYSGSRTKLWVFTAGEDNTFSSPVTWWDSGAGNWNWNNIKQIGGGDFNGDGLDDVGAFYNYGGSQTKLRIFYATGSDSFAIPTVAWDSGDGNWNWSKTKQVVGDFNGDGKDDVGAFYGYSGSRTKLWVFTAGEDNTFSSPVTWWDSGAGNWNWNNIKQIGGGDFNGDGLDDVGAFYNYGGSQTKLRIFYATGSDSFAIPTVAWDSGDGNWNWSKTKQVVGDFNGDGKDDVGAFYGYSGSRTKVWVFTAGQDNTFASPVTWWDSGAGNWNWSNVKQL